MVGTDDECFSRAHEETDDGWAALEKEEDGEAV
jgi:hypothetical protein